LKAFGVSEMNLVGGRGEEPSFGRVGSTYYFACIISGGCLNIGKI
jgi:hypothetical protein